ncbi:MAG: glycosyltransferase family 4 protein, partial [Gammaproteobacteria bacterium]
VGVGDLSGGGGTERYFADVFERYKREPERHFDLTLITDVESLARLQAVGRRIDPAYTLVVPTLGRITGLLRYGFSLLRLVMDRQFDLLHVALVNPRYLLFLWLLGHFRTAKRPRIVINMVNVALAHTYGKPELCRSWPERKSYWLNRLFLRYLKLDGLYTWYRLFRDRHGKRLPGTPLVVAASCLFVDTDRFKPAVIKHNVVVWAGRLIDVKQPLMFIDALVMLRDLSSELFANWVFRLYGAGPLEHKAHKAIADAHLGGNVTLTSSPSMHEVFAESRVFVSTHDFENFSSMSMLEAMSAGNAIIARPLGQTADWVKQGKNGLLSEEDTVESLAGALLTCLSDESRLTSFGMCSREIATREQCFDNVRRDLEAFWEAVLERAPVN